MESNTPRRHKIFWGSSYDRGVDVLLFMWPDIKAKYPDAELHICYGWNLFDKANANNPERMAWKANVETLMQQEGIYHHGRIGKKELNEVRSKCGVWAYCTYFTEINCITALECQRDGLVPVVCNFKDNVKGKEVYTALNETVFSGHKVEGNIRENKTQQLFLENLLYIMGDEEKWRKESIKAKKGARSYDWSNIASKWVEQFKSFVPKDVKVTVATVSIRKGWLDLMAKNLSQQTYKNFEWLIIDDYEVNRREMFEKYAQKYGLDIQYTRGDRVLGTYDRRYALARANNKAVANASGELIVWLQDFIVLPNNSIEKMVNLYRRHPDALIAPTDLYYFNPEDRKLDLDSVDDYWLGNCPSYEDLTDLSWKNIRNNYSGMRFSSNPFEFEMNIGATPKAIIEKLNGWYEFFDDGLGFDNTQIAHRALEAGYKLIVDDTNVAKCINLFPIVGGTKENLVDRERCMAVPHWEYYLAKFDRGEMPIVRDPKLDKVRLKFRVPDDIPDEDCATWTRDNAKNIANEWLGGEPHG